MREANQVRVAGDELNQVVLPYPLDDSLKTFAFVGDALRTFGSVRVGQGFLRPLRDEVFFRRRFVHAGLLAALSARLFDARIWRKAIRAVAYRRPGRRQRAAAARV